MEAGAGDPGSRPLHPADPSPGPCTALAEAALAEVLACPPGPAGRPYVTALVQLAAGLPLEEPCCQACPTPSCLGL